MPWSSRRMLHYRVFALAMFAFHADCRHGVSDESGDIQISADGGDELTAVGNEEPGNERPFHVGYRRMAFELDTLEGERVIRQLDLWYPTDERERPYLYLYQQGRNAENAEVAEGRHPLLLFSHGFRGTSDQSIYIMEACARAGYIVAAINHKDALLGGQADGIRPPRSIELEDWNDTHYRDRSHDLSVLLDTLLAWNNSPGHAWEGRIDPEAIGAIGHSLGGYTVLGMAGAWPSWRDERIKAVVVYSPNVHPFRMNGELESITIPVMMQGATLDIGISQYLLSIYRRLACPKHYLILEGATHLVWTNFVSLRTSTTECLEEDNPELIVDYTIAFFDQFLLQEDRREFLEADNPLLHDWACRLQIDAR